MLSDLQKRTAQAIVNIFETGQVRGDYGRVTLLAGDSGHLTYGRAQTTLASGNLYLLIARYCDAGAGDLANQLRGYLDRLQRCDLSLDGDRGLWALLRLAGDDPAMQRTQDAFFDDVYWSPAQRSAAYIGAETALGHSIVYDSRIHGSWHRLRDQTNAEHGELREIGEQAWMDQYVTVRRNWLATHPNALLHKTVYRMDSYRQIIGAANWTLALPLTVRGQRIDEAALNAPLPQQASARDSAERVLRLTDPYMEGEDVRALQEALRGSGLDVGIDGVYGPNTAAAVRTFQERSGLKPDGIAGPATFGALLP